MSARMIPTTSGAWATIVPHGSTIVERPKAGDPGGPLTWDGARTYAPFSIGPRPQQDLPVVAARPLGEVGRDGQDLGTGQRQ